MEINFVDRIPDYVDKILEKEYEMYSTEKGIDSTLRHFYMLAEKDKNLFGILAGHTIFSEVYVSDLVIIQGYRRRGIGTKLLSYTESYFQEKGFTNINLVTREFLAPEFYKKRGYSPEFIRKDEKSPELTKYFFIKWFNQKDNNI